MALAPGTRLGVFEVTALIGVGGMGEVYKATDTNLKRAVAIKVLPASVAGDAERLARFQREAEVLAALNHPNIAAIYGLERSGATTALVMELVEGDDLSQRIAKGAIPIDEALPIAKQIAEALEAAHEQGVIHRDLKPANIKVRPDGTVKVLDFGLAKAMEPAAGSSPSMSMSPTITTPAMTQAGMILGTAAYMSPEQARGKLVDKRADIWAFGCVLYEVLTRRQPFPGDDISHVLARVIERDPDFDALPPSVPARITQALRLCLRKDPKQRVGDIRDVRLALEGAFETAAPHSTPAATTEAPRGRLAWMAATAAMTVVAGVAVWGWLRPVPSEPRLLTHFTTVAPEGAGISPVAVSRDGTHLAFANAARNRIYIRAIDDPVAKLVPGTEGGKFPVFSPDGQSLAFIAGNSAPYQLKKVPIAGGASLTLVSDTLQNNAPPTWGDDGNILTGGPELRRVSEAGGTPMAIAKVDAAAGELFFAAPQLLPGGKYILAGIVTTKGISAVRTVAIDVATGKMTTLLDGAGVIFFAPTGVEPGIGHLVYGLDGSLFAAGFNAATLHVGPVAPVLEGTRNTGGLTAIGLSRSGTLAYPGLDNLLRAPSALMWVDRQGTEQPLTLPSRPYTDPRISPDGGRVAFVDFEVQTLDFQVWVHDLVRGTTTRLTFEGANRNPVWTADGKRLIYVSAKSYTSATGTLVSLAADGSGPPVTLMGEEVTPAPTSVSPDGKLVIGVRAQGRLTRTGNDIWVLPLEGEAKPQPFLDDRFMRGDLQFSPDGKWVAYELNEGGRTEIYVVPYPGPGGRSQVSTDGGTQPRWNRNGRELFFRSGDRMMAVDVETGAAFRAGAARVLFEKASSDYDVAPDGKRFLMLKPSATAGESTEIHVIVNWFDDLRRRVPLPK